MLFHLVDKLEHVLIFQCQPLNFFIESVNLLTQRFLFLSKMVLNLLSVDLFLMLKFGL